MKRLEKSISKYLELLSKRLKDKVPVKTGTLKNSIEPVEGTVDGIKMVSYASKVDERHSFMESAIEEAEQELDNVLDEGITEYINDIFKKVE